jgi:predicted glycosyltransferase
LWCQRHPRLRDLSLFVGNPDDPVDLPLGPDLPTVKAWTREHFQFSGYVLGAPPVPAEQREHLRATLGYRDGEQVCIVTAGGSSIGVSLLTRAAQAYPELREAMPQLRMIVVTGPRIDGSQIAAPPGVEVRGYVPDLAQHLAVCDAAIVQGGLSTCMELAANQCPFVYVPLQRHFEQQIHVAHRLANYGAGVRVDWPALNAESIADALTAQRRPSRPVEANGAETAATAIRELIG